MGFYLGKRTSVVFTSSTRQNTILRLQADSIDLGMEDTSIHISNIKPLRDANIENNLALKPDWENYGIPNNYLPGGMRNIKIKIHGFHYYDPTINVANGPRTPVIGEEGKLEVNYIFENNQKKTIFKADKLVVTKTDFSIEVAGGIEYDLEFDIIEMDVDYSLAFKV